MTEKEYLSAEELESITGTPASTWRYWASIGQGPPSQRLGRRRVWKRSTTLAWIECQPDTAKKVKTFVERLDAAPDGREFGAVIEDMFRSLELAQEAIDRATAALREVEADMGGSDE